MDAAGRPDCRWLGDQWVGATGYQKVGHLAHVGVRKLSSPGELTMGLSACSFVESLESRTLLAAGSLVPSFGEHGFAIPHFESSYFEQPIDAAMESDGDIVILGETGSSAESHHALVRFHPDGTLDSSFGNAGWVLFDGVANPVAVAVQPAGYIVVAGTNGAEYYTADPSGPLKRFYEWTSLIRFNSNGTRDDTFQLTRRDTHGNPDTGYMWMPARMLKSMPDGGLLLGYKVDGVPASMMIERLDANGQSLWTTSGTYSPNPAVAVQSDGAVLLAGSEPGVGSSLRRIRPDGTGGAASDFGLGNLSRSFTPNDITVNGEQIRIAGILDVVDQPQMLAIASLNLADQMGWTFGANGVVQAPLPPGTSGPVSFMPDGSILAAGMSGSPVSPDYHVVISHYSAAAQFDGTFGTGGVLKTGLTAPLVGIFAGPGVFTVVGTATSSDGKPDFGAERYAASGAAGSGIPFRAGYGGIGGTSMTTATAIPGGDTAVLYDDEGVTSLMRFGSNGKLVKSFGAGGVVRGVRFGSALAADAQGRIYVAGNVGYSVVVRRYLANGAVDKKFGGSGTASAGVWPATVGEAPYVSSIQLQSDGAILIGSSMGQISRIARLTSAGKFDTRFGSRGVVSLPAIPAQWQEVHLAVQTDGRIVVLRRISSGHSILMRLRSNGRRDAAFGWDATFGWMGAVETAWDARHIALEPDGRIVLSGQAYSDLVGLSRVTLARYDQRGQLDRKFGARGLAGYMVAGSSIFESSLAIQDDGKILVGVDDAVLRFNINGRIDSSFGKKGVFTPLVGPQKTRGSVLDVMARHNSDIIAAGNAGNNLYLARVSA